MPQRKPTDRKLREQLQNARENPIAAAAAAAAASGGPPPTNNNVENLLDIDFDGAAPASAQKEPELGATGLEGLGGTPLRVDSPATHGPGVVSTTNSDLNDLMGVFGNGHAPAPSNGPSDLLDGFASLDMGGGNQPPPAAEQLGQSDTTKKNHEDIMSLF